MTNFIILLADSHNNWTDWTGNILENELISADLVGCKYDKGSFDYNLMFVSVSCINKFQPESKQLIWQGCEAIS